MSSHNQVYRTGYVRISRPYHSSLQCCRGHRLYSYRLGDEGLAQVSCDLCEGSVSRDAGNFYGCRECNIDICDRCLQNGRASQDAINRLTPAPPPRVIEACCMVAIAQYSTESERLTAAARGERYNGRRPNYRGQRVSEWDYPDATEFGWTFTGSCEGGRAEFFEKDFAQHGIVKLDFYYTTGTVKTVLDHPRQGVTQLFAKGDTLSPEMYRAILQNPRHHTGNRYHRR